MSTDQEPLPEYLQELQLFQEDRDFIASLPTEKVCAGAYFHQYQGFWHPTMTLPGTLAFQKYFQARESDIFIVTTPKSGTTWLKAIVFALMYRHRFPNPEQHPLLTNNPHFLVPFIDFEYLKEPFPDFNNLDAPRLFSTHSPFVSLPKSVENTSCKIVYLCRNPKDVVVSYWQFYRKLIDEYSLELEENFDQFCRGVSVWGPFWDHVLGYWRKSQESPQIVFFLKYENLKREPKVQLKRLSEFLGCQFSREEEENGVIEKILELCSFDNLSNLDVNKNGKSPPGKMPHEVKYELYFRRGCVGDGINYLTAEMVERIDRITDKKLKDSGLELDDF